MAKRRFSFESLCKDIRTGPFMVLSPQSLDYICEVIRRAMELGYETGYKYGLKEQKKSWKP